jgi:hypothetical protein
VAVNPKSYSGIAVPELLLRIAPSLQVLINGIAGRVGPGTNFPDYALNDELSGNFSSSRSEIVGADEAEVLLFDLA